MKKKIYIIAACTVLAVSTAWAVTAFAKDNKKSDFNSTEYYSSITRSSGWKNNEDRTARGEMLELPENELKTMSTSDLVDAVVEYPFFMDIYALDNVKNSINVLKEFNGFQELTKRSDAAEVLIDKYSKEKVLTDENTKENIFKITNMEVLLAQDFVVDNLNKDNIDKLSEVAVRKYKEKCNSDVYSDATDSVFFDILDIDTDNENLESVTKETLNNLK